MRQLDTESFQYKLRLLIRNRLTLVGFIFLIFIFGLVMFGPLVSPYDPLAIDFSVKLNPPSFQHFLGTDNYGRDLMSRIFNGARYTLLAAFISVLIGLALGAPLGVISGFFGKMTDLMLMRTMDILLAFPPLILAMAIVSAIGPSLKSVMIALTAVWWPSYARLIRGDILQVREEDYIEAARGLGASSGRVIMRHALPNAIYPTLIMASLDIGAVVLSAAALSFLGLGAPEGYADWGQLTSFARNWIVGPLGDPLRYWYAVTIPGVFILFFVLGWNLLGDAFRDIFDPRLARR